MSYILATTKELFDRNLAYFENKLNQESPLNDVAFLRVTSAVTAMNYTGLNRFAADRARQNFALTADEWTLENIYGVELDTPRKAAEPFQCTLELEATTGTVIPAGRDFIGDSNGARYFTDSEVTASGGIALLDMTAEFAGVAGNLTEGETMTIGSQIAGASSVGEIIEITNIGADREDLEAYRRRILNELHAQGGGSNNRDFRVWSEAVAGVFRAFPYSGGPVGELAIPGDVTVYVEATTAIDPDGIAPPALLQEVRTAILFDPDTGISRPALGTTDEQLFVESIYRTGFYVEIRDLIVDAALEAATKANIETALDEYFRTIVPYIEGLDPETTRTDKITDLTISSVVQDILTPVSGSAGGIGFGTEVDVFLASYILGLGELSKLISVIYV
jgi:uncharacterized phage protein gp47/JayE